MSNGPPPKKKHKIAPPKAPLRAAAGLLLARDRQPHTKTIPRAPRAPVSGSADSTAAASSYPALSEPSRKPSVAPATLESPAARMIVPNLKAATAPPSDLQKIDDLGSDMDKDELDDEEKTKGSDDGSEGESDSDKQGGSDGENSPDEDDDGDEDNSDEEVSEKTGEHLFETESDLERTERRVHEMRSLFEAHSRRATVKPKVKPTRPTPSPPASDKKRVVEVDRKAVEDHQSEEYTEGIIKAHSRACLISLFGFKKAQDAAHVVLTYDDKGGPVWFKPGGRIAIPHLDRDFQENFAAWGPKFYSLVNDASRMQDPDEKDFLLSVPREKFRDALPTGAFGSMVRAWRENRDGKGEEVRQKKNRNSRRAGRKKQKSKQRMGSLKRSKLPVHKFAFVADPEFQSSEHSDPEDKSHCTIVTRECVAPEVSKLVDALDVEFESQKSRAGNPVYTRIDRIQTNTKLKMSKGQKVPQWGIEPGWIEANGALGRTSKPFIDSRLETMPNADKVTRFIHDHEPEKRVYKHHNPAPTSEDLIPVSEPTPPSETPPIALPAAQPFFQPVAQPAPAHAPAPSNQIPFFPSYAQQLTHYGLDQHALEFAQAPYGLFSENTAGYALPPPDYMLNANDFDAAPGAQVDSSHPFTMGRGTFDTVMAQVQDATAGNFVLRSDQAAGSASATNPLIPGPSGGSQVPNTEAAAPVVKPAQPRSSGRHRRATAKAAEMAGVAELETSESSETTVLKPKFSKAGKKRVEMVEKGKGKGKGKGKESVEGKKAGEDNQAPTPGRSRKPFNIGKIQKIKFKKLPGE